MCACEKEYSKGTGNAQLGKKDHDKTEYMNDS